HMLAVLKRAAQHKGAAFVEIWQNCVVFNDGAFDEWSEKDVRDERLLKLEHGKPLVYGKARDKGLRIGGGFTLEQGAAEGAVVHDESRDSVSLAMALAALEPPYPQVMGVLRAVDLPTVDQLARQQEQEAAKAKGPASLEALLPKSSDEITRLRAAAAKTPMAAPMATIRPASRITIRVTPDGEAPNARRTPISGVRCSTVNEITP